MNIIHIRETAKAMHKAGLFDQKTMIRLATSPVFDYERPKAQLTDQELAWAKENLMDDVHGMIPTKFPFPILTIACKNEERDPAFREDGTMFVFAGPRQNIIAHAAVGGHVNQDFKKGEKSVLTVIRQDKFRGHIGWLVVSFTGEKKNGVLLSTLIDGQPIDNSKVGRQEAIDMAAKVISDLTRFAFDTMSHFSVTLRVTPKNTPGKSVEWHMARTHYLIIGRKQAQLCQVHRRGPSGEEITRAAHWRKSHFKKLVAAKWKFKQGQTVLVKKAWVGPKEWEGTDGKVYKVIES